MLYQIIDGIEKMLKIVPDEDEERLVHLQFELITARSTINALQETQYVVQDGEISHAITMCREENRTVNINTPL